MSFFFLIPIVILLIFYGYVGNRLFIFPGFSRKLKLAISLVIIILSVLPFISLFLIRTETGIPFSGVVALIGFTVMGLFSIAVWLILPWDILRALYFLTKKLITLLGKFIPAANVHRKEISNGRRNFLKTAINTGILAVSGVLTGYGYVNAGHPRVKEILIPCENPVDDLLNLRIVQITDIHAGHIIKGDFVRAVVNQVNNLKPDIIALTGDLVDGSVSRLQEHVAPLKDLESKYGNFFVTGNHEYYSGVDQWLDKISELGFTILLNEHRVINHFNSRIIIGGVTDYSQKSGNHATDPYLSLKNAPDADIRILLAHQPLSIYEASKAGYDLQISGHTHGGQYFPWSELVSMSQPFLSGIYRHEKSWVYVSEGTGYWGPPLRIGTRPEITLIRIVHQKSKG